MMATQNGWAVAGKNLVHLIEAKNGAEQGFALLGVEAVGFMKKTLNKAGTGIIYTRGAVQHRASKPGKPPAPDFGKYKDSWDFLVRQKLGKKVELSVGTPDIRGPWLEFGTSRNGLSSARRAMAARPHLRLLVPRMAKAMPKVMARAMAAAQRRAKVRLKKP